MYQQKIMMPESEVEKSGFSLIWIIPIIALLTGVWMIYQSYSKKGVEIYLTFKNGEGIVAEKTIIKYSGVEIGKVNSVLLDSSAKKVKVKATLLKEYGHFAQEGSLFWIVKPRLEVGGISGLETIVTGQYLTIRPGKGEAKFNFNALENPPPSDPSSPGLHLVLESDSLGSLVSGSPVLYKKIKVGKVETHSLSKDKNKVFIHIIIYKEYSTLVKKSTRFWNVSGISISGDLSGIKVKASSLSSVIDGGITFETPKSEKDLIPSKNKDIFKLYDDRESAMEHGYPITVIFNTGEGIVPGSTPIKYKGITIGKVTQVDVVKRTRQISASILLQERAKLVAKVGSQFWVVKPRFDLKGVSGLGTILSGQYIEVKPSKSNIDEKIFYALSSPPFTDTDSPGLHLILKSKSLGSLSEGSPVHTKGIEVGRIEGYELTDECVNISIHIFDKYSDKVFENTRFWNDSGISIKGGIAGIEFNSGSIESLIAGGIVFDTPYYKGKAAKSGLKFRLFDNIFNALESGKKIDIEFEDASNLIKDSTPLKYKGITIGKVTDINLGNNGESVLAKITLHPNAPVINQSTSVFHLVKPDLSIDKIAGLETIVTGSYINVIKGVGELKTRFKGYEEIPLNLPQKKGVIIRLACNELGSINPGTPVLYKGLEAGVITKTELLDDKFIINAFVFDPFFKNIYENTKFYNSSGLNLKADLSGVNIDMESIKTIILGGISFENQKDQSKNSFKKDKIFKLYKNRTKAMEQGFYIDITFNEGYGLEANNTKIIYKGLVVGEIRKIDFHADKKTIISKAFIHRSAKDLIKEDSKFILRGPVIGLDGIKRLETLITGNFIEIIKGNGKFSTSFTGLKKYKKNNKNALFVTIETSRLGSLDIGKPVFYRQVKVGKIEGYKLKKDSTAVLIDISIEKKYAPIVRKNSKFWYSGILSTQIGLTGIKVNTETLETMIKGGISFATPDSGSITAKAKNNDIFKLYMEPKKKWLKWKPKIEFETE